MPGCLRRPGLPGTELSVLYTYYCTRAISTMIQCNIIFVLFCFFIDITTRCCCFFPSASLVLASRRSGCVRAWPVVDVLCVYGIYPPTPDLDQFFTISLPGRVHFSAEVVVKDLPQIPTTNTNINFRWTVYRAAETALVVAHTIVNHAICSGNARAYLCKSPARRRAIPPRDLRKLDAK